MFSKHLNGQLDAQLDAQLRQMLQRLTEVGCLLDDT